MFGEKLCIYGFALQIANPQIAPFAEGPQMKF
jgi:hypothetical protein